MAEIDRKLLTLIDIFVMYLQLRPLRQGKFQRIHLELDQEKEYRFLRRGWECFHVRLMNVKERRVVKQEFYY